MVKMYLKTAYNNFYKYILIDKLSHSKTSLSKKAGQVSNPPAVLSLINLIRMQFNPPMSKKKKVW